MAAVDQQPQPRPAKQNERPKPVTQLEFRQAMSDFKTMFPEMDEDVIEVVLRANKGTVDATIDQLLSMTTDNENERLRAELDATENDELPPSYSPATPPPSYHQAVPYGHNPDRLAMLQMGRKALSSHQSHLQGIRTISLPASAIQKVAPPLVPEDSGNQKSEVCHKKRWNPPLLGPLPPTFLRFDDHPQLQRTRKGKFMTLSSAMLQKRMLENERQRRNTISADDPELAQFLEDERVALFLQNEEFLRELMGNQEFLTTLEKDTASNDSMTIQTKHYQISRNAEKSCGGAESNTTAEDIVGVSQPPDETDAVFRERLKNMGKLSKRKFAQLASIFSRRKRAFKPILGDGNNPSRDNLLLHEDEYSELSEEDSDSDWNKKDSWNSHNGDFSEKPSLNNFHKNDHS